MRDIDKIIIHCSDSSHDTTVKDIRRWHVEERGWSDIGYHYIVMPNGAVQSGRPVYKVGAHCKGQNGNSIGVCMIGKNYFTPNQFKSLKNILTSLKNIFDVTIHPHNEFNKNKTCPNFDISEVMNVRIN